MSGFVVGDMVTNGARSFRVLALQDRWVWVSPISAACRDTTDGPLTFRADTLASEPTEPKGES